MFTGDILEIDGRGEISRSGYNDEKLYTVVRFEEAHPRNAGKKRTARNPSGTNRRYGTWKNYRSCRTLARPWKRS